MRSPVLYRFQVSRRTLRPVDGDSIARRLLQLICSRSVYLITPFVRRFQVLRKTWPHRRKKYRFPRLESCELLWIYWIYSHLEYLLSKRTSIPRRSRVEVTLHKRYHKKVPLNNYLAFCLFNNFSSSSIPSSAENLAPSSNKISFPRFTPIRSIYSPTELQFFVDPV